MRSHALQRQKFGRLTVLRRIGTKNDTANWLCGCLCGSYTEATTGDLCRTSRPKRSCGKCYDHKIYPSEWLAWRNMQNRCYSQDSKDYKNYGARGITVSDNWRQDFFNFLLDMGLKPRADFTLERKNNSLGYCKENCIWASRLIQNNNRRNTNTLFKFVFCKER